MTKIFLQKKAPRTTVLLVRFASLASLEKQQVADAPAPAQPIRKVRSGRALQGSLFATRPEPLLEEPKQIDPSTVSPELAIELIQKLKDLAQYGTQLRASTTVALARF
jgi:hypothetical protein